MQIEVVHILYQLSGLRKREGPGSFGSVTVNTDGKHRSPHQPWLVQALNPFWGFGLGTTSPAQHRGISGEKQFMCSPAASQRAVIRKEPSQE